MPTKPIQALEEQLDEQARERIMQVVDAVVAAKKRAGKVVVVTGSGPNVHEGVTTLIAELMRLGIVDGVTTSSAVVAHEMGGVLDKVKRVDGKALGIDERLLPHGDTFELTLTDDETKNEIAEFMPIDRDLLSRLAAADGETLFNNGGATTDGPDEPGVCDIFDYTQIGSDIWFCYQATCSDPAVVSLCGSSYDTKMAVYEGCGCPSAAPIACSDDDCGSGFESRITFQATVGQSYLIRIGGFEGAQGDGTLNILCGQEVCAAGSGDCSTDTGTRGCDDVDCCNTTCAVDPYCCDVEWDQLCADESAGLCAGSFAACAAGAGSCETAHDTGAAGCSAVDCCDSVCMQDPFCCVDTWDDLCAQTALGTCLLACGSASDGGCFTANSSPGCETVACCQKVCVEGDPENNVTPDPFCCDTEWDQTCADTAATICRGLP